METLLRPALRAHSCWNGAYASDLVRAGRLTLPMGISRGIRAQFLGCKVSEECFNPLGGFKPALESGWLRFRVDSEPWVEREVTWHHYYLRSNLTYDSFFREHIESQGGVYQYVVGFQGGAEDALQHTLPFVFSHPWIVKEVLRYTLKGYSPTAACRTELWGMEH